jgi:hypothetical protein
VERYTDWRRSKSNFGRFQARPVVAGGMFHHPELWFEGILASNRIKAGPIVAK